MNIKEIKCLHCKTPFPSTEWKGVCTSCKKKIEYYCECITTRKNYPSPRKRQLSSIFYLKDVILKKNIDNENLYDIILPEGGWETLKDIIDAFLKDNKLDDKTLQKVSFQDCVRYDYNILKGIKSKNTIFIKKNYFCYEDEEDKLLEEPVDIAGTVFIDYKNYQTRYNLHLMITVIKEA